MPEGVTCAIKCRKVSVKGPRGELFLDLAHLPIDLSVSEDGKKVVVERWFTSGKQAASIRTACTHVNNMFIGVTKVRLAAPRCAHSERPRQSGRWPPAEALAVGALAVQRSRLPPVGRRAVDDAQSSATVASRARTPLLIRLRTR